MQPEIHQMVKTSLAAVILAICITASFSTYSDSPISMDGMMMKLAVENNDAAAQYFIGRNYLVGKTVHVNKAEAAKWFSEAAKQGHEKAQFELARLYLLGDGVEQNTIFAFDLMMSAAKQDHIDAQYQLGKMYLEGLSGSTNTDKAVEWLNKAVESNHTPAMYTLGKIYYEGKIVNRKRTTGLKLLKDANDQGSRDARKYLSALQ
jgi:TPR repeat protein